MFFITQVVFFSFFFYSVIKIIRRKLCKPNYEGKVVWITGASSGIGQYLAYEFNKCGAKLIISARNLQQLERVKQNCINKQRVKLVKLDMTNFKAVENITMEVIKQLQEINMKIDVVVQNAGVSMRSEFRNYDFTNHLSMFNVNVNGPFCHIQTLLNHMIKNRSGHIVAITSVQGKLSPSFRTSYAGSKHALIGILDSLRSQVYQYGIKVTNIMPGYVNTNLSKNAFASGQGQKYGQNTQNGKKGMDPQIFCREAVKAIAMGQKEAQISNQPDVPIGICLRNLCPDIVFFILGLKAKKDQELSNKSDIQSKNK